jgi:hypothetical protein
MSDDGNIGLYSALFKPIPPSRRSPTTDRQECGPDVKALS